VAGNASGSSITVVLDNAPPTITAAVNPAPNAAGWHKGNVTVSFSCADAASGIASCSTPVIVTTEGAGQAISGTAVDLAGNSATTSVTLNIDKTPPAIAISSPANGATLSASPVSVTGTIAETLSGIAGIGCNGTPATLSASTFTCNLPLVNGVNTVVVDAIDVAGNAASSTISVNFVPGPVVTITSPATGSTVNASAIIVRGVVDVPAGTEVGVTVNGSPAAVQGGSFVALVPVTPDTPSLTAVATTPAGVTASHSIAIGVSAAPAPAVTLLVSPKSGIASLTSHFTILSDFVPTQVELDANGDGTVDFTGAQLQEQPFTFSQSGVYVATAKVADSQGNQFTANAIVQVYDQVELDARMQIKWAGMKDALVSGSVPEALIQIVARARDTYATLFNSLGPWIFDFGADMPLIQPVYFGGEYAKYRLRRQQLVAGTTMTVTYYVYFSIDSDGIWRLESF
jgi:hypothetical protein